MGERIRLLEELLEQVRILNEDESFVIPLSEAREKHGPVTRIKEILKEILIETEALAIIRKAGARG